MEFKVVSQQEYLAMLQEAFKFYRILFRTDAQAQFHALRDVNNKVVYEYSGG